ncbi:hypothetical protein MBLNU457_g0659t2 [Dothideomycetes sp. NU457]
MDNMGEAADIHRGLWDPSLKPVGSHYSVLSSLPQMLSILSSESIKATYFIEGWNSGVYPDAIKRVRDEGHEVGFHAWQHEVWKGLDYETEVTNLSKSIDGVGELGIEYAGFRPPGGLVTDKTLGLMKEKGLRYLSPAAQRCAVVEDVAMVPFQWRDIDAYFYLPSLAPIRKMQGDGEECLSPEVLKERLVRRIDEVATSGGFLALLFHPFLQTDEERMRIMREVVEYVKTKGESVWVAPCGEVAEWVLKNREEFGSDPGWDTAEWKKK